MNDDQFETRLRELESMTGQGVSMDMFNEAYESLLNEVKVLPGPRFRLVERMAKVLARQTEYMVDEWLRAKAIDKIAGSGSGVTEKGMN